MGVIATFLYAPDLLADDAYVDCFNMSFKSRVISVHPLLNIGSHNSESLAVSIEFLLWNAYNCLLSKVLCFLLGDNAPVNPAAADRLGKLFFGCLSHKSNLVLKDILDQIESLKVLKDSKVNPTISYFRRSDIARTNAFIEKTIQTYSKTRWYSNFESLHSIRVNKDKIINYFRVH